MYHDTFKTAPPENQANTLYCRCLYVRLDCSFIITVGTSLLTVSASPLAQLLELCLPLHAKRLLKLGRARSLLGTLTYKVDTTGCGRVHNFARSGIGKLIPPELQ